MKALTTLLDKYLTGDLTPAERQQLAEMIDLPENRPQLEDFVRQVMLSDRYVDDFSLGVKERLDGFLAARMTKPVRSLYRWWAAAAAVLLLACGVLLFSIENHRPTDAVVMNDAPPGSTKATLTLADGTRVELDSTGDQLIRPGIRQENGQLAYDEKAGVSYNTLSTPRGGQFRLKLPDGTQVWLNAASSIRYPTMFNGKERKVTVTGEAYFEVAPQAARPFLVDADGRLEITVLGTSFNVHAYKDEAYISTTLLEGSVRAGGIVLKPGQQLNGAKLVDHANTEKAIAWKNGIFNFEDASLEEVMKQIERWYDIEIVYEKGIPDIRFGGKISRNISLAGLLRSLEDVGVRFKIEGNKLLVKP